MDPDLIAIRMRLYGGRQVEQEGKRGAKGVGAPGLAAEESARRTTRASTSIRRSLMAQMATMRAVGATWRSTGSTMTTHLSLPLAGVGYLAIRTAAEFDKSMAQVGIATELGGRKLERMRALAMKMGADTIFSANEAAEAMLELSKAGIGAAEIRAGALAATMDLAAAGGQDLATSAVQIGAAMNTFSIKADQSRRIADALAGGANQSSASLSDLALALQQAGQQAVSSRLSIFETVGTLAAFADQGIRGSDAGTSFKVFLQRLNPATKKAAEEMNRLGINFYDAHGRMKDLIGIQAELQTGLAGLSQKERGHAMQVLFGTDAYRAATVMYRLGRGELENYVRATEHQGEAQQMAQAQMKGLPGALERLRGSLETAALAGGHAATPAIIAVAGAIEGLANGFTALPEPAQQVIVTLLAVVAAAGPLIWILGAIMSAIGTVGAPLLALAGWIGEVGAAIAAFGAKEAMTAWAPKWMGGLAKGLGVAAAAYGIGNIISSAVEGETRDALFKGGYAVAGGILGSIFGPAGTMIGVGLGSALGGAMSDLFDSQKQLGPLQRKLKDSAQQLTFWLQRQREASNGLTGANRRLNRAEENLHGASGRLRRARSALSAAVRRYGPDSRPAWRAEVRLTGAINDHRQALRRLKNAQKLHGTALDAYKTITNNTVLEERHRVNVLEQLADRQARAYQAAKAANPQSQQTINKARALNDTLGKLRDAENKHAQTLRDAATKAGPKYAEFLRTASREGLEFGSELRAMKAKADRFAESMERIADLPPIKPEILGAPPIRPIPQPAGPPTPKGANGFRNFRGGLALVGERGPELALLAPGTDLLPAPETRELLTRERPQVRGSRSLGQSTARRGRGRTKQPIVVQVGRRVIAEVVVEEQEDDEARG